MRPVLKTATSIPEHERARSAAPPTSPWTLLGEIPRTSLACLALTVGYAGLAWRAGRELSLLEELQISWPNWRHHRRGPKGRSGRTSADADDLRQIGGAEDGADGSQRKACGGAPLLRGTHPAKDRDRIEPVVVNSGTTAQAF